MAVNYIPEGYRTVTPYLAVKGVDRLISFIETVFGGKEVLRMAGPGGKVAHAEMMIGDTKIMMGEPVDDGKIMPAMLNVYVPDCDAVYKKAVAAGGKSSREPEDQFYGDRSAGVMDPFGNHWFIATHIEDVSEEETQRRASAMHQK
jgi:PhnB protein